MSGAHRLIVGEIPKDLKGEEYLKAVDKLTDSADKGEEKNEE